MSKPVTFEMLKQKAARKFSNPQDFINWVIKNLSIVCQSEQIEPFERYLVALFAQATRLDQNTVWVNVLQYIFSRQRMPEKIFASLDSVHDFVRGVKPVRMLNAGQKIRSGKGSKSRGDPIPLDRYFAPRLRTVD